jgi:hypothetical protein
MNIILPLVLMFIIFYHNINKEHYTNEKKVKVSRTFRKTSYPKNWFNTFNKMVSGSDTVFEGDYKMENSVKEQVPAPYIREAVMTDVFGQNLTIREKDKQIKKYIVDKVINRGKEQFREIDKTVAGSSRDEIDEFRNDQLKFNNKINMNSDPELDVVDKMNKITINGGIKTDLTIAQYYDTLVE